MVRDAIPHARLAVLDGCSHYLHLDRPRAFLDALVEWAAD
jgi:pimeloyl-ACP methyl ester carboxylesterase